MFCLKGMNNGTLKGMHVMPQKDLSSDNESSFAMGRRQYIRTLGVDTTLVNGNSRDTLQNQVQKKWYGNSSVRDSSKVMEKKVRNEIGNGSLNASKELMSFTETKDVNTRMDALRRVRNIGSSVPAIKTHNYPNAPIFY
jgi:hypothetical protein